MNNIISNIGPSFITEATVKAEVGLCYFDPIDEALYEVDAMPNYFIGADSYSSIVHKYYLVSSANVTLSKVKILLRRDADVEQYFDIKILTGSSQPALEMFDIVPTYNSVVINGPIASHTLIPVWIFVQSKDKFNTTVKLPVDIEYEL